MVSIHLAPHGLNIVIAATSGMSKIAGVFNFTAKPEHQKIREMFHANTSPVDLHTFQNNATLIVYFQIYILAALSMCGGLSVPIIRQFSERINKISVQWDGGIHTSFEWGGHNDFFCHFFSTFSRRVLDMHSPKLAIGDYFKRIMSILQSDLAQISNSRNELNEILQNHKLEKIFEKKLTASTLFSLIAALPEEQLNSLLIYVQKYFPDDLQIKSPDGNIVQICSLFEMPSTDIHFLNQKVLIYLNLYLSTELPIIQEITQSKTKEFLTELLRNEQFAKQARTHIDTSVKTLFDTYFNLYTLLIKQYDKMIYA